MTSELHAVVARGKAKGLILRPHVQDDHHIVSMTRFEADYVRVPLHQPLERWLARLDHIVTSPMARARKPEPAFFAFAQRHTDAEPGECLFIDDLPINVEAAQRFGWKGLVYRADGTLAEKLRAAGVEIA